MKKFIPIATIAVFLGLVACKDPNTVEGGSTKQAAKGTGTNYELDLDKSKIQWKGSKVSGFHTGSIQIKSGSFTADEKGIVNAGKFTIDMTSIVVEDLTGEYKQKLEGHLKNTDFFEVDKYPEGTFEITGTKAVDTGLDIEGNLTLRGISKGINFPAVLAVENGKPVSAQAVVKINRQNWGIVYKGKTDDLISDTIELNLNLVTK